MSHSSSPLPVAKAPSSVRRVIVASLIGTSLEWYDFFIYGTAAALVFNKLFFPSFEPLVGTLLAFTTYAVGFVARPLGGIVFGHYGDKLGRKNVLVVTLLLMGIATFLIGVLPTYDTIGVWAPILLVALRFLQGLGLGGEWGGAVLMTLESGDPNRRGLNASWPQVGVPIGLLLANGVLVADGCDHLGGSIPLLGLASSLPAQRPAGGRRTLDPADHRGEPALPRGRADRHQGGRPDHGGAAALSQAGVAGGGCASRRGRGLLHLRPVHHHLRRHLPRAAAQLRPQRGADRGRHPGLSPSRSSAGSRTGSAGGPVYLAGAIGAAVWVFVFFALLDTGQFVLIVLAAVVALIFHAAMYGPQAAFIAEMFPTKVRYTGASMGYQLAGIVGGALAPIISVALLDRFDTSIAVSVYVVAMLMITITCVLLAPETSRIDLHADPAEDKPARRR